MSLTPDYPVCLMCRHFKGVDQGCKAFPEGIPPEVLAGDRHHFGPDYDVQGYGVDADSGVYFEVLDGHQPMVAKWIKLFTEKHRDRLADTVEPEDGELV